MTELVLEKEVNFEYLSHVDIPLLMDLEREAFPLDAWPEEDFRKLIETNPEDLLTLKEDNTIAGYVFVETGENFIDRRKEEGCISSIAVLEKYRGKGFGKKLLKKGIEKLKAKGAKKVFLHTREGNLAMQKLAESFGFSKVRVIEGFYSVDEASAIEMELSL